MAKTIRTKIYLYTAVLAGAILLGLFAWSQLTFASIGTLQIYNGSAQVVNNGRTAGSSSGTQVHLHDLIRTSDHSRIAIVLKDNSVIRLESNSETEIDQLDYQGSTLKNAVFKLHFGRLWSHITHQPHGSPFQVETPTTVAVVRGTSFDVSYLNTQSDVYVYRSVVESYLLTKPHNKQIIPAGEAIITHPVSIASDFLNGPLPVKSEFFDDWIIFNQKEDDKLDGVTNLASPTSIPTTEALQNILPTQTPDSTPTVAATSSPSPSPHPTLKPTNKPARL